MGEGNSKPEAPHEMSHADNSMSPAQKAFAESFKSDKRNVGTFPLMEFSMSGQEFKYTDVRTHHGVVVPDKLSFEMFWSGELEGLDQTLFVMKVTETLAKFGAAVAPTLREAGCMISMVAIPFSISEENAFLLGKAMFDDFGDVQLEVKKEEAKAEEKKEEPKA